MKRGLISVCLLFLLMNIAAIFHAYKFTHFTSGNIKTKKPSELTMTEKISTALLGIDNPGPKNEILPTQNFKTIYLPNNPNIEVWGLEAENTKGTIILFHGFSASKSSLIEHSNEFLKLGYSTMLVDFIGSGGSLGNITTIGFKEAQTVNDCFDYLKGKGEKNIHLFGNSMGAAAVLKAQSEFELKPKSIILECPFGSMVETVEARFNIMKIPSFPMANLLVFWGGTMNGFWAFGHNPIDYAEDITCPVLLFYGAKDPKVSRSEIDRIFENLRGKKQLIVFENTKHENYLRNNKEEWVKAVVEFNK